MFVFKFSFILLALALVAHADDQCPSPDQFDPECQTSKGSPKLDDCQKAIDAMDANTTCTASNDWGSKCTTLKAHGTCRLSACVTGQQVAFVDPGQDICKAYLRRILDKCPSGDLVGGLIVPSTCSTSKLIEDAKPSPIVQPILGYRVELSHT